MGGENGMGTRAKRNAGTVDACMREDARLCVLRAWSAAWRGQRREGKAGEERMNDPVRLYEYEGGKWSARRW